MKEYDLIIIGFGKAGKTLAKAASEAGQKVALVEKSKKMYGGTCINIACIPTKTLIQASRRGLNFKKAIDYKYEVVEALNRKNYEGLASDPNVTIIDGEAKFVDNKILDIYVKGDVSQRIIGNKIVINTGAQTNIPSIEGLHEAKNVYTSTTIMEITEAPKDLVIVGGGYIALEFASMMASFGTKVTVLERSEQLMVREDQEIVEKVKKDLEEQGIQFVCNVNVEKITTEEDKTTVQTSQGNYEADAILLAVGRHANTESLQLENTDIQLNDRGEIVVDEALETTVEGVYAAGDVKGGLQFTYISLDDFRILKSQLYGDKSRTTHNRGEIPYSVFITPVLSRIGLTYEEAIKKGYSAVENKVAVSTIPRHKINNDSRGLFKVVVDQETNLILGASLYGENSEEIINYIKLAMDNDIKYTYIRDAIFTHPTMIESFNDLMNI